MKNAKLCIMCRIEEQNSKEKVTIVKIKEEKYLCPKHKKIFTAINAFNDSGEFADWNDFFIQFHYNHNGFIKTMTEIADGYIEIAMKTNKEKELWNALRFRKFVGMRHNKFTVTEMQRLKVLWNNLPATLKKGGQIQL